MSESKSDQSNVASTQPVGSPVEMQFNARTPSILTPIIGREREITDVCELLLQSGADLVTLTGPGGVGKTRLALAIGKRLEREFAGGVIFVDLSAVHDPSYVLPEIAFQVGAREGDGDVDHATLLRQFLAERRLLLILDNCEQISSAAPAIGALVDSSPGLKILATSRAP